MDEPGFVEVARTLEPMRAEMIRSYLESSGITVLAPGSIASVMGVAGERYGPSGAIEIAIQVPSDRAEEATRLLYSLEHGEVVLDDENGGDHGFAEATPELSPGAALEGAEGSTASDDDIAPTEPRRKIIVVFLSLILGFGAAHVHVREHGSGLVLCAATIAGFMIVGDYPWMAYALIALRVVDLIGALKALKRFNEGLPRPLFNQVCTMLPISLGLLFAATLTPT